MYNTQTEQYRYNNKKEIIHHYKESLKIQNIIIFLFVPALFSPIFQSPIFVIKREQPPTILLSFFFYCSPLYSGQSHHSVLKSCIKNPLTGQTAFFFLSERETQDMQNEFLFLYSILLFYQRKRVGREKMLFPFPVYLTGNCGGIQCVFIYGKKYMMQF